MQAICSLSPSASFFPTNNPLPRISVRTASNRYSTRRVNIRNLSSRASSQPDTRLAFDFSPRLRPRIQRFPTRVQAAKKTYTSFDELLNNSDKPLLVDFYATWCGPCQFMVPVLDSVGKALKDELRIVKIDTEKYPNIASRYGVQALPTLMIFRNGQPIDRLEGALPAPELIKRIKAVLSTSKTKARE